MKRLYTGLAIGLGLLLLYTLALGTRRAVLEAQYRKVGSDLPFTLESALQYRRVKIVHDTGRLPPVDVLIQYPEGVENRTTYNVGSESLYAAAARAFPASVPFANRLRWVEAAWFCLGIPLLACWLLVHTDLSVEAVAERLGYSDTSNFSRTFRRWLGMPPNAFRASRHQPAAAPTHE